MSEPTWIAYKRETFIYWRRYFMGEALYFLAMAVIFDCIISVVVSAPDYISGKAVALAIAVAGNLACVWRGWLAVLRSALNRSLVQHDPVRDSSPTEEG